MRRSGAAIDPAATPVRLGDEPALTVRHALISTFILVHLVGMICMAAPIAVGPVRLMRGRIEPYMRAIGLAQAWPMFAPDPPAANTRVEARITYRSGAEVVWRIPSPPDYGIFDRYFVERYRSWGDFVRADDFLPLRTAAARYVARTHGTDPADPPASVVLIRYWAPIAPPGDRHADAVWHREEYFTYAVGPQDLQ